MLCLKRKCLDFFQMMGCLNQAFWTWFNHVTHLADRREKKNMEDFFPRQELTNNLVLGALARKNFAAPTRLKHLLFSFGRHCLKSKVAFNCIYLNSNFFFLTFIWRQKQPKRILQHVWRLMFCVHKSFLWQKVEISSKLVWQYQRKSSFVLWSQQQQQKRQKTIQQQFFFWT